MENFNRITHVPGTMGGRATIRGIRVTVEMIVRQIRGGATEDELLREFPYIEREDMRQSLLYQAQFEAQGKTAFYTRQPEWLED